MMPGSRVSSRCRAGHTLLELTIVATILSLLLTMVARAQRPFSEMVLQLQDRSVSASELHLAADFLARDLGAAAEVVRRADDALLIRREPVMAARLGLGEEDRDPGILYRFRDGQLLRRDLQLGGTFAVATGLTGLDVGLMRHGEMRIKISDGVGDDLHEVTLVWSRR
jgi:type II secretory pathway component PulJ